MIDYAKVHPGDILRIVGAQCPAFAPAGELVRVTAVAKDGVWVEDKEGRRCEFALDRGAARLEPTEWKADAAGEFFTKAAEGKTA
jgi:hypothetical protein